MESALPCWKGVEIAVTGRFASMTQAQFRALVQSLGARLVRNLTLRTRWLVVGQGELPLGPDGKPNAALEMARLLTRHGCDLQVLPEDEFLDHLGLGQSAEGTRRRTTLVELARLLGLPVVRIREWIRRGLIDPAEVVHGVALFDFQQVAAARTLCELLESGIPPAEVRQGLNQLRRLFPDWKSPLQGVSVLESTSRVVVRLDNGQLAEASGQRCFDFDSADAAETESLSFVAIARTSADLFQDAVALEAAGRLEDAARTYERALHQDPDDPILRFNFGNVQMQLGQLSAAVQQYQHAVESDPSWASAWQNLGVALFELRHYEDSAMALRRALQLVPVGSDVAGNLQRVEAMREAGAAIR